MCNFQLNGSVLWLLNTDDASCFICKEDIERVTHLFFLNPSLDSSYLLTSEMLMVGSTVSREPSIGQTPCCHTVQNLIQVNSMDLDVLGIYSMYTERRSVSENCIIDNTHCIVFSF